MKQRILQRENKTSYLHGSQTICVPRSNAEQEPEADEMGLAAESVPVGDQEPEGEAKCRSGCPIESGCPAGSNWWRGKLGRVISWRRIKRNNGLFKKSCQGWGERRNTM